MKREDDFQTRRAHLQGMSDQELKDYFWKLAQQVVDPLLELGYRNTTPAIERSVLLRMGFSSLEAKPIVDQAVAHELIAHGAGNLVYRLSKDAGMTIREAGLALAAGQMWDRVEKLFEGGEKA